MELKITHFLLFVVAAFLLYYLTNGCCNGVIDGFSVGGDNTCSINFDGYDTCEKLNTLIKKSDDLNTKIDTLTNRFDEFLCQIIDSEKCIDKTKIGNCKISN